MIVTDVKILLKKEAKLKAYVSITLDDCFVIRDIKIIEGKGRLFIAMPCRKRTDGSHRDIAHPLNAETRRMLEEKILDAYYQMAGNQAVLEPVDQVDGDVTGGSRGNGHTPVVDELAEEMDRSLEDHFNR